MWVILIPGLPLELIITVAAGILVLLCVCIIAMCVRNKMKDQHDVNNQQALYNQSTESCSGGYATAKPHTLSSWACTYKAGQQRQADTHIWETPLPQPCVPSTDVNIPLTDRRHHTDTQVPKATVDSIEYTMPVSNKSSRLADLKQDPSEYTQPVITSDHIDIRKQAQSHPDERHSQANCYYYYDPSSSEQTEYMQPANVRDQSKPVPEENMM